MLKKPKTKEIKLLKREITLQQLVSTPKESVSLKMKKAKTWKKS
jgi:hypothetical protein